MWGNGEGAASMEGEIENKEKKRETDDAREEEKIHEKQRKREMAQIISDLYS
jgi:hypothetical protein